MKWWQNHAKIAGDCSLAVGFGSTVTSGPVHEKLGTFNFKIRSGMQSSKLDHMFQKLRTELACYSRSPARNYYFWSNMQCFKICNRPCPQSFSCSHMITLGCLVTTLWHLCLSERCSYSRFEQAFQAWVQAQLPCRLTLASQTSKRIDCQMMWSEYNLISNKDLWMVCIISAQSKPCDAIHVVSTMDQMESMPESW